MAAVTWTWDSAKRRLTAACTGLSPSTDYEMRVETQYGGGGARITSNTSDGSGDLTLEFTDWVPMGPSNFFWAHVYEISTLEDVSVNVFTRDVSSAGDGVSAAFSSDGADTYTVMIQTLTGRNYTLVAFDPAVAGAETAFVGDGTVMTVSVDTSATPFTPGDVVELRVSDYDLHNPGNGGPVVAAATITAGSVSADETNPGGGTYEPDFVIEADAVEGAWVFSYNGTDTIVATGTGLLPGRVYAFILDGCSDNFTEVGTADGAGHLTLTQTGITDPSTCYGGGPGMQAVILGGSYFQLAIPGWAGGIGKATTIFQYGTAGSGGEGLAGVEWTFDGTQFGTVAIPTTIGVTYDISSWGDGSVISIDGPIVGDGSTMTLHWRIENPLVDGSNSGLFSQYVPELFDDGAAFQDYGGILFTYAEAFPEVSAPVLVSSPPWRFVVTNRETATLTFLDRLATNREVHLVLNDAATCSGDVPSDNPEVNIVTDTGHPFLDYNRRLLYAFRREGHPTAWVVRFAGILMQLGREAQTDQGVSHFTAFDPWGYWDLRPIVTASLILPKRGGMTFTNTRGSEIALALLANSFAAHGGLYVDFGQTAFYGGTVEDTDRVDIAFEQTTSLGDAMRQLCDTGSLDIVLTPVYDPINRPGICCELNIYQQAGTRRNGAIFAWDMPSRSLSGIDLLHDGKQMANKAAVWVSSANQPVPIQTDADSVDDYGQYWLLKNDSGTGANIATGELIGAAALALQRLGKTTITIDPTPERSPVPFNEYVLGDEVPVYASVAFGEEIGPGTVVDGRWTNMLRILEIPITIGDDEVETVAGMVLTGEPAIETVHS